MDWRATTKYPNPPQVPSLRRVNSFTLRKSVSPAQPSKNKCFNLDLPILLQQQKTNGCWAATATMMMSWKEKKPLKVDGFLQSVDPRYEKIYKKNLRMSEVDYDAFLNKAGFKTDPPTSYSMDGLLHILRNNGPLGLIIDGGIGADGEPQTHAVLVTGVCGDGTDDGTVVSYVDPTTGKSGASNFGAFRARYNSANAGANVRGVHF